MDKKPGLLEVVRAYRGLNELMKRMVADEGMVAFADNAVVAQDMGS